MLLTKLHRARLRRAFQLTLAGLACSAAACSPADEREPTDAQGGSAGVSTQAGRPSGGTSAGMPVQVGGANPAGGANAGTNAGGSGGQGGTLGQAGMAGAGGSSATAGNAGSSMAGTGGSNTGGSGGSGGGAAYRPCPTDGSACKILPLGDSITWGIQYDGAYRVQLFSKALADGHKITFTGSVSNGPNMVSNQPFPRANEGHSGWRIDQITGLVPKPALDTVPHIVLLMIGTNDVYAASGQATMPERLGGLLDKLTSAAPNALIVVAKITPLNNAGSNATIKTYNDAIPGLVQTRAAAGKHIILGDMNTGFTSAMLSNDGVHPNKSGYDFMGDTWYKLISSFLP
ncbi:MAG TPA: SGNH/GDSL hydrolase family protein [Polyangiaceae bacterium]|nr:SGNH/GDSL hydrolase family protein [Polyangiaceae bacterium]